MDHDNAAMQPAPPSYGPGPPKSSSQPLIYRRRPIALYLVYATLLLVPWVLLCYVDRRTLDAGVAWSVSSQRRHENYIAAARIVNTVAALVAVPFTSAIIAYTAVTFSQRRNPKQKLSLQQLFALADRRWETLYIIITEKSTGFMWLATALFLLVVIQLPLQAILVPYRPRLMLLCDTDTRDSNWRSSCGGSRTVGSEPDPSVLDYRGANSTNSLLIGTLQNASDLRWDESSVWPPVFLKEEDDDDPPILPRRISELMGQRHGNSTVWVSALSSSTYTGFLRQHVLGLNSTVECKRIQRSAFPPVCPGARPFVISFSQGGVDLKICAPADFSQPRWEPHRDRQDIAEDLYIDLVSTVPNPPRWEDWPTDSTVHCTGRTTRAYFELPNRHIGWRNLRMLESWPSAEESRSKFHDTGYYGDVPRDYTRSKSYSSLEDRPPYIQGPMVASAMAYFGPYSVFGEINQTLAGNLTAEGIYALCRDIKYPFEDVSFEPLGTEMFTSLWNMAEFCPSRTRPLAESQDAMVTILHYYLMTFQKPDVFQEALSISTAMANHVYLQLSSEASRGGGTQLRAILRADGVNVTMPSATLGVIIALSILIGLQLLILLYFTVLACWLPTWTRSLDAAALAAIGAQLSSKLEFPPLGMMRPNKFDDELVKYDSLIGVVEPEAHAPPSAVAGALELRDLSSSRPTHASATQRSSISSVATSGGSRSHGDTSTTPVRDTFDRLPPPDLEAGIERPLTPPPDYLATSAVEAGSRPHIRGDYELAVGASGLISRQVYKQAEKMNQNRAEAWRKAQAAARSTRQEEMRQIRAAEVRSQIEYEEMARRQAQQA